MERYPALLASSNNQLFLILSLTLLFRSDKLPRMNVKIIIFLLLFQSLIAQAQSIPPIGTSADELFTIYPRDTARTYRTAQNEEWITFNQQSELITFHLKEGKLVEILSNNRLEVVEEYLSEFCSQSILAHYPKISSAIRNALNKLPNDVFIFVTNRAHPVLFSEYYHKGIARFANSSEIISLENDPPTFSNGLAIIKLSTELELAEDSEAIEGIIFHELAHRYLEHGLLSEHSKELEREANRTVKSWGFEKEFQKAKERFGYAHEVNKR